MLEVSEATLAQMAGQFGRIKSEDAKRRNELDGE